MPLVDSNDPALWDGGVNSLYRSYGVNGVLRGFERAAMPDYYGVDSDRLEAALRGLGLTTSHRIVFVGCGFAWTTERFMALGYGPLADGTANGKLASVDTSTWIHANKGNGNATVPIVNEDLNAATGRRAIKQLFGSPTATIDWAITEDILPILVGVGPSPGGNNEIVPFCSNVRQLANNVAHWITCGVRRFDDPNTWAGDPRLNWKTLEQWKAWTSPDYCIARNEKARVL